MTAGSFRIRESYVDPGTLPEVTDEALRQTYAELQIQIDGEVLTKHVDAEDRVQQSCFIPALPLATWFAKCWPSLVSDFHPFGPLTTTDARELLARVTPDQWDKRDAELSSWLRQHSLLFVGDGLLLPDVRFLRAGSLVGITWRPSTAADAVHFLGEGHVEVQFADFAREVKRFVSTVGERISAVTTTSSAAFEFRDWARVFEPSDERIVDVLAARVGRSAGDLRKWLGADAKNLANAKKKIAEAYGGSLDAAVDPDDFDAPIAKAARSAAPVLQAEDHERLLPLAKQLRAQPAAQGLMDLRERATSAELRDFDLDASTGYRRARAVRRALRSATPARLDIEAVLLRLGVSVIEVTLTHVDLDGLAIWDKKGRALIAVNTASPRAAKAWGRRSLLAHELYHLLFDANDDALFGEITGRISTTPSEPSANAFSAELLMPTNALPKRVSTFWTRREALHAVVDKLCTSYEVGREVVLRQLQHQRQLPEAIVIDELRDPPLGQGRMSRTNSKRRRR